MFVATIALSVSVSAICEKSHYATDLVDWKCFGLSEVTGIAEGEDACLQECCSQGAVCEVWQYCGVECAKRHNQPILVTLSDGKMASGLHTVHATVMGDYVRRQKTSSGATGLHLEQLYEQVKAGGGNHSYHHVLRYEDAKGWKVYRDGALVLYADEVGEHVYSPVAITAPWVDAQTKETMVMEVTSDPVSNVVLGSCFHGKRSSCSPSVGWIGGGNLVLSLPVGMNNVDGVLVGKRNDEL
jgi:hypothetical protein